MGRKTFLAFCLFAPWLTLAQWGCTDPQANNFDPNAILNDGSCQYNTTNYSMTLVQNLNDLLQENSGLVRVGNYLYTVNDSGGENLIYELDTLGNLLRSIEVQGATNIDWEALTSNSTHLFIGDFGNNNGNRQDLCLYRVIKSELIQDTVQAEKLLFYWSDQIDFTPSPNATDFDCEAFIASEDSIRLFTKNWNNLGSNVYQLPNYWTDTIPAQRIDSFFVNGLITDACQSPQGNQVYLLGYKNNGNNFYTSFIWNLWDFNGSHLFSGNKRRIEIGSVLTVSQTESIALSSSHQGFVSAEKVVSVITIAPKLFSFDFNQYFTYAASPEIISNPPYSIIYHPAIHAHEVKINSSFKRCFLSDMTGRILCQSDESGSMITSAHGPVLLTMNDNTCVLFLP